MLCDAARGWRIQRSLYVKTVRSTIGEEVTDNTATRDLRALVDARLIVPEGERRGRIYRPSDTLLDVWREIRSHRRRRGVDDPYQLVQPALPGMEKR